MRLKLIWFIIGKHHWGESFWKVFPYGQNTEAMVQWEAKAVHQTWQQNLPIMFEGLPHDTGFESNSGMKGVMERSWSLTLDGRVTQVPKGKPKEANGEGTVSVLQWRPQFSGCQDCEIYQGQQHVWNGVGLGLQDKLCVLWDGKAREASG